MAELVAALGAEKAPARQRVILRQLGPVVGKADQPTVEKFLASPDPWVRRAALAGLAYATEDPKHLEAVARDVQETLKGATTQTTIRGHETGVAWSANGWLSDNYFFLDPSGRKWGTRWSEPEADKCTRIVRAIRKLGVLDPGVTKWVDGD